MTFIVAIVGTPAWDDPASHDMEGSEQTADRGASVGFIELRPSLSLGQWPTNLKVLKPY